MRSGRWEESTEETEQQCLVREQEEREWGCLESLEETVSKRHC